MSFKAHCFQDCFPLTSRCIEKSGSDGIREYRMRPLCRALSITILFALSVAALPAQQRGDTLIIKECIRTSIDRYERA